MELAQIIENSMDQLPYKLTWAEIARKTGMSHTSFSKFKNHGGEINFKALYTIAKLIYPHNYHTVIAEWSYHIEAPVNLKFALEYMSFNRLFEQAEINIERIKESGTTSKLLIDLVHSYTLLLKRQQMAQTPVEFINDIKKCTYKTPEGKFLRSMLKAYYYSDMRQYYLMNENLKIAESLLDNINDEDLRELYSLRVKELKSVSLLFNQNRKEEARVLCEEIIGHEIFYNRTYEAGSNFRLGVSYLFSSYDMAIAHLKRAVCLYKELNRHDVAQEIEGTEIEFAKVLWGKADVETLKNDCSRAFFYAANDQPDKALQIIEGLNQDSAFTRFYKGLATKDTSLILESMVMLSKGGNLLFANLPYTELIKHPHLRETAELLIKP